MTEPDHSVHDDFERQIGTVQRVEAGSTKWRARGLDQAHIAVHLDWALGRPRTADTHERYHRAPGLGVPVFLGH